MAKIDQIIRALGWLNASKIKTDDPQLYQAIKALIDNQSIVTTTVVGNTASFLASYLTVNNDSLTLPNSRMLIAGLNITFDDTIPSQRTIAANASGIVSFAKIFMMGA